MELKLVDRLITENPCPEAWQDVDETRHPRAEVGYIRADHDGHHWWNTIWPIHRDLATPEIAVEIDEVYDAFMKGFRTLNEMRKYCLERAQKTSDGTEFNAWLEMPLGYYWLRMITRERDYNLYLHCISKAALGR